MIGLRAQDSVGNPILCYEVMGRAFFVAVHESEIGSAPQRRESSLEEESTRRVVD